MPPGHTNKAEYFTVQVLFAQRKKVKGNRVKIPNDPVTVNGYSDAHAIAER